MTRLPWAIWLVTVAIFVAIVPSALGDGLGLFLSYVLFVLAFATVGAIVASRRPRNAIGWLLLLAGLSYVIGGLSETVGADESALVAWVGEWIWLVGIGPVATFGLLLFPNGRLPSRRWRPVAWLAAAGLLVSVGAVAFKPGQFEDSTIENPFGIPGLPDWAGTAALFVLLAALAGSIASLVARYRAAGALERGQLKWLLYAAAIVAAGVVGTAPLEALLGDTGVDITNVVVTLTLATVPVAMGIAILRHRLYDIDLVIRRTLVYGVLTATLGATYLGLRAADRARRGSLGARGGRLDAGGGRALPPGARAHPGRGRPPLLPPPLRRRPDARGVRHAAARRARPRGAGHRPARCRAGHGPARARDAVAEERAMRRLAWLVFGVWVAVSVVALALVTGETDKFVLIVTPALAGYAVVGALVAGRQPRNAIGWLLLAIAILFSLSNVVEALATRSAHPAAVVMWLDDWLSDVWICLVGVWIPLLFPNGHLPSRAWRPVAWFGTAAFGLGVLTRAFGVA